MDIIPLINDFVTGLFEAEDKFFCDLKGFTSLEKDVKRLSEQFSTAFLSMVLTGADELIRKSSLRKTHYNIQRKYARTMVSTMGDISYERTMFQERETGKRVFLLDQMMHLPERERLTPLAEAGLIREAEVYSYQHAADVISTERHRITKTTVMNKVHALEEDLPDFTPPKEKKKCEYLYIEADEDHIHRQKSGQEDGCLIGKLAYLFEGKEEICKGKKRLKEAHYISGLYPGERNREFWDQMEQYIQTHYDQDYLKCVYISSDGGTWIKAAKESIYKGKLVADRFHLMKYINRVCSLTGEKREINKGRFYKYIWKNKLLAAKKTFGENPHEERRGKGCR